MIRILVWNIQNFTRGRITAGAGASALEIAGAEASLRYILTTVTEADPDVFVILEARCEQGAAGTLATGEGPQGLLDLLAALRGSPGAPPWRLVPPLRVNPVVINETGAIDPTRTETVGVFWRSDRVTFDGPAPWPAGYADPWTDEVRGGIDKAAQCRFWRGGHEVVFPTINHRRPYLTTFRDGAGRTLRLFSIHTSPATADVAIRALEVMEEGDWKPGAGQLTVFAGDFNLNLAREESSAAAESFKQLAFRTLGQMGMTLIVPWESLPPLQLIPGSIYFPRAEATPRRYTRDALLDYAYVRFGDGAPDPEPRMVVASRVPGVVPQNVDARLNLPGFTRRMAVDPAGMQARVIALDHAKWNKNQITFHTSFPHALKDGDTVAVADVNDPAFNASYKVLEVDLGTFTVGTKTRRANVTGIGGTATSNDPGIRVFRRFENFGHMAAPVGAFGTSDHLPIFFSV